MQQPIRVFIIEDHRLFAEAVAVSLRSREEEISLVGSATSPGEALERIKSLAVDVLLIGALLAKMDAPQATQVMKGEFPNIKVIVLGLDDTEETILNLIEAGANGYLLKTASFGEMVHTIEAVHKEQAPCLPRIAARVFARIAELSREQSQLRAFQNVPLTPREIDILHLIAASLSNKEIAGRLNISLATVKNHVHNVLDKLHVRYRREAALCAIANDTFKALGPPRLGLRQD